MAADSQLNGNRRVRDDSESENDGQRRKRQRVPNSSTEFELANGNVNGDGKPNGEVDNGQVGINEVEKLYVPPLSNEDNRLLSNVLTKVGFEFDKYEKKTKNDMFGYVIYAQKILDFFKEQKERQARQVSSANGSAGGNGSSNGQRED
ncbi:unnamed protein product [Ambrosiozyma monospora]|uniref:Unnamed protein product n=1 Tax=Ambrosiozyma monospora TaxID=43982 RepID=A0ACB5UBI9_AMBMO|nr:unnamed protein product [Ambrosiozyma monospora]